MYPRKSIHSSACVLVRVHLRLASRLCTDAEALTTGTDELLENGLMLVIPHTNYTNQDLGGDFDSMLCGFEVAQEPPETLMAARTTLHPKSRKSDRSPTKPRLGLR